MGMSRKVIYALAGLAIATAAGSAGQLVGPPMAEAFLKLERRALLDSR